MNMMNEVMMLRRLMRGYSNRACRICYVVLLMISGEVEAKLPTPVKPSTNPNAGNWLDLIKGYAKDAGLVIGLVIAVVAFLWIAWITIAKFNDARSGKAEWGEVGLTAVVAAGVMIFISFLLTEASNVI